MHNIAAHNTVAVEMVGLARDRSGSSEEIVLSNIQNLEAKMWEMVRGINWKNTSAMPLTGPYSMNTEVVARLGEINEFLLSNIEKRVGADDWRENLRFINGLIAAISFSTVVGNHSLVFSKVILVLGGLSYKMLGLYVDTIVAKRDYYRSQYRKMHHALGKAYDAGVTRLSSSFINELWNEEGGAVRGEKNQEPSLEADKELLCIMEAMVVAFYNMEKAPGGVKIEDLSGARVVDCYINMLRAAITYTIPRGDIEGGKKGMSIAPENVVELSEKFQSLLMQEIHTLQGSVLPAMCYYGCKEKNMEVPSVKEFSNIISSCYRDKNHIVYSGKELLEVALSSEEFTIDGWKGVLHPGEKSPGSRYNEESLTQNNEIFTKIGDVIQDEKKMRQYFIYTNVAMLVSSSAYSMSISFVKFDQVYIAIPSSVLSFMLGQISDMVQAKIEKRYKLFQDAKTELENSLKNGFEQSSKDNHRIEWFKLSGDKLEASDRLHQINYTVVKTWSNLSDDNQVEISTLDAQDMATVSMHMYIAMGKAYERGGSVVYLATIRQLNRIARNWTDLIEEYIRLNKCCSFTGIWGVSYGASFEEIPAVDKFYATVDMVINVSAIKKNVEKVGNMWNYAVKRLIKISPQAVERDKLYDEDEKDDAFSPRMQALTDEPMESRVAASASSMPKKRSIGDGLSTYFSSIVSRMDSPLRKRGEIKSGVVVGDDLSRKKSVGEELSTLVANVVANGGNNSPGKSLRRADSRGSYVLLQGNSSPEDSGIDDVVLPQRSGINLGMIADGASSSVTSPLGISLQEIFGGLYEARASDSITVQENDESDDMRVYFDCYSSPQKKGVSSGGGDNMRMSSSLSDSSYGSTVSDTGRLHHTYLGGCEGVSLSGVLSVAKPIRMRAVSDGVIMTRVSNVDKLDIRRSASYEGVLCYG